MLEKISRKYDLAISDIHVTKWFHNCMIVYNYENMGQNEGAKPL